MKQNVKSVVIVCVGGQVLKKGRTRKSKGEDRNDCFRQNAV